MSLKVGRWRVSWNTAKTASVGEMQGVTMRDVCRHVIDREDDFLLFVSEEGPAWLLYHAQDCCENVTIEDIVGDLDDLVGAPLLLSEETVGDCRDVDFGDEMWTYYRFATVKGDVSVRWVGRSNGYYSVRVNCVRVHAVEEAV